MSTEKTDEGQQKQNPAKRKTAFNLSIVFLAATLGFLIGNKVALDRGNLDSTWPIFIIVAVVILAASIIKDGWIEKGISRTLKDIQDVVLAHGENVQDVIDKNLQPHIISLDIEEKVFEAATEVIEQLLNEKGRQDRKIVYVGSASLSQTASPENEEDETSPFARYTDAVRRLMASDDISIMRYISLLDPADFAGRSTATQERYRQWLEKHKMLVKDNLHYHILHCARAPNWGGSKTSMITHHAIIDIVGNGTSGLRINGDQVAREMMAGTERLLDGTRRQPEPIMYDDQKFSSYMRKLDDAVAKSRRRQNSKKSKS